MNKRIKVIMILKIKIKLKQNCKKINKLLINKNNKMQ